MDWLRICDASPRLVEQTAHPGLWDCSPRDAIGGSSYKDGLDQYQNPGISQGFDPVDPLCK